MFSRLKLSGRWDYAELEIFILQTGGEGESIVRSDWLHDEKESRAATMISIFSLPRSVGSFVPQVCCCLTGEEYQGEFIASIQQCM